MEIGIENESFFFENHDFNSFFKEEIKIIYKPNLEKIYHAIRYMNYREFIEFRHDFINYYEKRSGECKTLAAKGKYWERVVTEIEREFGFDRPQSTSMKAEYMRKKRGIK